MVALTKQEIIDALRRLGFNTETEIASNIRAYREYYILKSITENEFFIKRHFKRLLCHLNLGNIFH
jgi:hypothetical protein